MTRSLLRPSCPGWREDLPLPHEKQLIDKTLGHMEPNHSDYTYLEIPRKTLYARNLFFLMTIGMSTLLLITPSILLSDITTEDIGVTLAGISALACNIWCVILGFKISTRPPRDEPIRFNRARQRIYAYNFVHRWWNPFEKWRTVPVAYDWSQVRAERWSQGGALPSGGMIFKSGVVLSIIRPGTNEVIDRFQLTTMGANEYAWAYICAYMQEGPSALPPPGEPKDHNDLLWCQFASRLAPKVVWPIEMDIESRTALASKQLHSSSDCR